MASLEVRFYFDTLYIFPVKICSTIHTWAQKVYLSSLEDYDTLCGYCSDDLGTGVEKFSVSKFLKSYCLIKSLKVDFWCVGGGSFMGKNSICGLKLIFLHCFV